MTQHSGRYERQQAISGWDQSRLRSATVLVAGAGATGNEVLRLLAMVGVGEIYIVDFDTVELSNLSRCSLFRESDIGAHKAVVAANAINALNPDVCAVPVVGDICYDFGVGRARKLDLALGCLDSINARLGLNRLCLLSGTPWFDAGIESDYGQISRFSSRPTSDSPCFECGMTDSMWAHRNMRYTCSGTPADVVENAPTSALPAAAVAAYMVHFATQYLMWDGDDNPAGLAAGSRAVLSLFHPDISIHQLPANPECENHHTMPMPDYVSDGPSIVTARQLISLAGQGHGSLHLGFDLATCVRCSHCGATQEVLAPVEKVQSNWETCPECAQQTRRLEQISQIGTESSYLDTPLSRLGVPHGEVLQIHYPGKTVTVQIGAVASLRETFNGTWRANRG